MRVFLCQILGLLTFCGTLFAADLPLGFSPESWWLHTGAEFPGAQGALAFPTAGSLRLEADFTNGGDYVQAALKNNLNFPAAKAVRFEVRTSATRISFRFRDATGQSHQRSLPLSGDAAAFQTLTFLLEPTGLAWGGAKDKLFHSPLTHFGVILRKVCLAEPTGSAEFRNFTLIGVAEDAKLPILYSFPKPELNYKDPGSSEPLEILLSMGPARLSAEELAFRYCDYRGKEVKKGTATFDESTRMLRIPVPQEIGYYDLHLPALDIQTAVVIQTAFSGKEDEFFGMDTSLSRKNHIGGDSLRSLMKILRRNGIVWGRDRFSWGDVHPKQDQIDFNGRSGRYDLFRKIAGEEGVKILDVFHDTPAWNKQLASERDNFLFGGDSGGYEYGSNVYPRNLLEAANSWSAICRNWSQIKALEVWNEPDIFFGNYFPPEFFIAFTKSVSTRFALDRVPTTVVGGNLAHPGDGSDYYRSLIEGGLLEDIDVFSFHSYRLTETHEEQIAFLREVERKTSPRKLGIPYWITESGMPWPRGTSRAPVDADRYSASEIVGKAIEFRALGIERYFTFCYPYYDERKNNFGMIDQHFAPMRSLAAYGNCAMLLANKEYIGDLVVPGAVRSRVFSDGKESIACIYAPMKASRKVTLPEGLRITKITGLDGRELKWEGGTLPLEDGILYLHIKGKPGSKFMKSDTRAMRLYQYAKNYKPQPRAAKPVVIQPNYNLARMPYGYGGIYLIPGEPFVAELYWNNHSDRPVTVLPQLTLPEGVKADAVSLKPLVIPANDRVVFHYTLIADRKLSLDRYASVVVSDRNGNATPMYMPMKLLLRGMGESGKTIEISEWRNWGGSQIKADVKANFRVDYTADTLKLRIEVEDADHRCDYPMDAAWRGDSVQISLWSGSGHSVELCASSSTDGLNVWRHRPVDRVGRVEQVKFAFSREGKQTVYTLEIPAAEFGAKELIAGQMLGLTVIVNSNDGKGRNGFLHWGSGVDGDKNPNLFHQLKLN